MTKQDIANAVLLCLALIGAVTCFVLGKSEAGYVLMAFVGGHAMPSPLNRTPAIERVEGEQS